VEGARDGATCRRARLQTRRHTVGAAGDDLELGSSASACVAFNGIFVPIKLQIVMIDVGHLMVYSSSVLEDCSGAEEAKAMGCWIV
jgi:hypothetical protein